MLVLGPLEWGTGIGQSQLLPVSGSGPRDRSYKVLWLVAACSGLGVTWEWLCCELRLATTSARLSAA